MARSTKIRSRWRRWSRRLALGVLAAVTASILIILPLRWIDPVTGSFILQDDSGRDPVLHAWVSWEQLGSTAALAVVAAADQRYPVLQRLMPSLIENATADGYLFDLVPGGHDKKRSHNFVKRIGLWIRANVSKDKTLTAYTSRHSYAQALRDLGVDKETIEYTTGHKDQSMLFGTYAKQEGIDHLREAVDQLDFGFGTEA